MEWLRELDNVLEFEGSELQAVDGVGAEVSGNVPDEYLVVVGNAGC